MGQQVLLTGATGFVGKVVLAELLRRADELDIERVYVVIRAKRGKPPAQRFEDEIAGARVFSLLPVDWAGRVTPIAGELSQPDAGLAADVLEQVQATVTWIVHCAASVEFDLPLGEAAEANIQGALNVLAIARNCQRLARMVSVSTAYVAPWRPNQGPITEVLAALPFSAAETYEAILAGRADAAALMRQSGHPNTYTLTKCLAEHLLVERRGQVQLSIVRPSIISATLERPFPGWLDSAAAFAGFVALVGSGYLRVVVADRASEIDVVPCDIVADAILAELAPADEGAAPRIRHAVAGPDRNLNLNMTSEVTVAFFTRYPGERVAALRHLGPLDVRFGFEEWRWQRLPLSLARLVLGAARQPKQARRVARLAEKLRYLNRAFPYFTQNAFAFVCAEPAPMPTFEPRAYTELVCGAVSRNLLQRDPALMSLAGRADAPLPGVDWAWALGRPHGSVADRALALLLRKALRASTEAVTFDQLALEQVLAEVPSDARLVLVPSNHSAIDFLLCAYMCFARPELGLRVPVLVGAGELTDLPAFGPLVARARAIYFNRGLALDDPELTQRLQALVAAGEVFACALDQAGAPTLLRSLQTSGHTFALVPIAISYEHPPATESAAPGARWRKGTHADGAASLGRIHLAPGAAVLLAPHDDATDVAKRVQAGLARGLSAPA